MIDNDLSGAFVWTPPEEAKRIREESDVHRSYGELRAEWQAEQRRKKSAKRDAFAWVFILLGILFAGIGLWVAAGAS